MRTTTNARIQGTNVKSATKKKIKYTNTVYTLPEGKMYSGEVIESKTFEKDSIDKWSIKIRLDGQNLIFANVTILPLSEYSPLNNLLYELDTDDVGEVDPEELVDYAVDFTTRISPDGYCGFKTISLIHGEEEPTEDMSDFDDEEDEN